MISLERARELVLAQVRRMAAEEVELGGAVGRVLAADVVTDSDLPPFRRACMDGFACRREDLGRPLRQVALLAAGGWPDFVVGAGECVRIMTGAPVPEGSDMVFKVEESAVDDAGLVRFCGSESVDNIARRGEDLKAGEVVVPAGTVIEARHVGVLASVGAVRPVVARRPVVAILATGDELVEPGEIPRPGQIRNSNGPQVVAQVVGAGAVASYQGIVPDRLELAVPLIERALAGADLLLLTGGVSMGDFDFVPEALARCGVRTLFDRVAIKPGKPATFGHNERSLVFGLPGNPVSVFVIFHLLVGPLLRAMMGASVVERVGRAQLATNYYRRQAERLDALPVRFDEEGRAVPVPFHGSGHFHALALATGLAMIPVGQGELPAGTVVETRLF